MTKTTRRLPFTSEPAQPLNVGPHFRRQNFYRHPIAEQDMTRAIDSAHAALTEQRFHLILAVEHRVDNRSRISLQHFAVNRTEAHAVIIFCFAGGAVFHFGGSSLTHAAAPSGGLGNLLRVSVPLWFNLSRELNHRDTET